MATLCTAPPPALSGKMLTDHRPATADVLVVVPADKERVDDGESLETIALDAL